MHISQLVINGFKTFNSKTSVEFGDGITAVVGPNGCGKTNIVDAIRWVLGEQKYSTLRSTRMEDIIFNGAKGTKPMSMCEVYLTVKNDRGKLPVEYTDVEIGRRLYRDGESEYFINRNSCRLKDINNLFIDTGMGADSYSVIELKMIEQILSESDEGRKFLFEEAAGINKYKTQRRLSLKKFEATKFDLERINDIISEVDTKVKGLNLQLKRFKRHATIVENLKENELDLSSLQINKFLELSRPLRKKIDEYSHLRESKVSDQNIQESELIKLRKTYSDQETEIQAIRKEINILDENREDARQKVLIWQEQNKSAENDIERLKSESINIDSRIEKFQKTIKDISNEVESILPQIDEKLTLFKSEQNKFEDLETTYKSDQTSVDKIQTERWELQKEISENKSIAISTESTIKERNTVINRLTQKISSESETIEKLLINEKEFDTKHTSHLKLIEDIENNKNNVDTEISKNSKKLNELVINEQSLITKLESLSNQIQFYKELIESQSDRPSGLSYILDKKIESESIIGTIYEIFSTKELYEKAINTALGDFAHSLISNNKTSAVEIIKNIQSQKAGKISIIPFDEVENKNIELSKIPQDNSIIDRASNLIKCDSKFRNIADLLLGNILVVNDIESAIKNPKLNVFTLIDLNGVIYSDDSIFKHPSTVKGTTIGRKEKIKSLQLAIDKQQKLISEIKSEISTLNEYQISLNDEKNELNSKLKSEKTEFEKSKLDFQRLKFEIENKNQIVTESKNELKDVSKSITELQNSILLLNEKIIKSEKFISGIQHKLDDANEKLDISRKERDTHHQAMQDIRIELLNLENNRDNLNLQKKTSNSTISEIQERQNTIVNEIEQIKNHTIERTEQVSVKEKELIEINDTLNKNRSNLELKEQSYREIYRSIEKIENRIKSEQQSRESILEDLKQCEVSIAEYNQQIKSIKERMAEKYNSQIDINKSIELSAEELEQDIAKLERSLEVIGPVNMAVQNEFEEEQKRLDHLISQRDDLIEAEGYLRESIEKIDRIARKQYRETFDHIKENFENLFTIFFEGGQGTLELIGDPDPLEADIAIRAQPPGKRNQTLRMLSAGEKSLTAIALLFAIYQYKPSPYCILDEVDAPLDDTNVRKFTRALKSFSTDTQFIIVTHNKLTMEAANYLYGVTMEKKGVSKLVSVKFD